MNRILLITALLAAGAAQAQPAPRNGLPPPAGGLMSPEALATVPDLSPAQQIEVRKILIQRRDAHDAVRAKERSERDAQMARVRAEDERIDDASSAQLRKLLGDDGYRALAQWLSQAHPRGPGRAAMPSPPPPALGTLDPILAIPFAQDDDNDLSARMR